MQTDIKLSSAYISIHHQKIKPRWNHHAIVATATTTTFRNRHGIMTMPAEIVFANHASLTHCLSF